MNAVKVLPSIFKAAKKIYDMAKQVKANKHQCQRECPLRQYRALQSIIVLLDRLERTRATGRVRTEGELRGLLQLGGYGQSVSQPGRYIGRSR